ncbi:Phosphinothricin acetyltransferase [Stanieria cyanosphaera PCC 7437]|uniref:Phosphinothricin acetyltransferase n=1 Tax=Stanieria cyanosphaera (strain ATCC 29371 / PCC 7437) TaxID=111780 RepID=K9XN91_STAC7|nr:GNAT family N-acetyltransferase [Stanieria cyanosphaera]AFZ34003.1 Phosphinothricin acetyltransferase [Stanieria cyanosphaera PCC 7437]
MLIRDAVETDLSTIVTIYNDSISGRLATADLEPVTSESRIAWFHNRDANRPIWVVEKEQIVVAWLSFQSFYGRPAYHATAEISIYVSPCDQRQGIAQSLLQKAIAHSPQLKLKRLLAFIFAHNQPSLNLFTKLQFQQWGYLPGVATIDQIERDLVILGRYVI